MLFFEIDMIFQSMDVLILQGGGARRRSPSPRSLTQGVYCFPEFQFVVTSLIIFEQIQFSIRTFLDGLTS